MTILILYPHIMFITVPSFIMISTDLVQGNANSIAIGPAPKFLKEGTAYYSYDGHYFYTSYKNLVDDKKVNKNPYYNYYQYVPHRTTSYLNHAVYNTYVNDESALYNQADVFFLIYKLNTQSTHL